MPIGSTTPSGTKSEAAMPGASSPRTSVIFDLPFVHKDDELGERGGFSPPPHLSLYSYDQVRGSGATKKR
jgi:hypothetical protein